MKLQLKRIVIASYSFALLFPLLALKSNSEIISQYPRQNRQQVTYSDNHLSSNRSDYYAQSNQDLIDFSRRERREAKELLERVENETEQKMEDANRRCNSGDQRACDEAYQMLERRILGEERAADYMERRSRNWRR